LSFFDEPITELLLLRCGWRFGLVHSLAQLKVIPTSRDRRRDRLIEMGILGSLQAFAIEVVKAGYPKVLVFLRLECARTSLSSQTGCWGAQVLILKAEVMCEQYRSNLGSLGGAPSAW